jgi:hypothetical protein
MGWSGPRTREGRRKPKWWSNQRVPGSSPGAPTNPKQGPGGNVGAFLLELSVSWAGGTCFHATTASYAVRPLSTYRP